MGVELIYKHQEKTYELMKEELEKEGKAAYVYPTGTGKSFPVLKYIEQHPEQRVLFVSPNVGIIEQMKKYISTYILDGGKVDKKTFPNFRGITYQKISLTEKMADMHPDVIVFDEIHRMGAEKWEEGIDRLTQDYPEAKLIGMSATPERTDKRNMAYEKFGKIIYEMSLTEALSGEKEGEVVLNGARYVRVISELKGEIEKYREQIEGVEDEEKRAKLLKKYEKLESIVSKSPDMSDILGEALEKKNGKYLVFCTDREDMFKKMEEASEIFGKVNDKINIDYVLTSNGETGKTRAENERTIKGFEERRKGKKLNLLFCVDMLNEGRHIEGLDGEIMLRPTESQIVYKQQIGRVLTAQKDADETVIVDGVNNWLRQLDAFQELEGAIRAGGERKGKKKKSYSYDLFKLSGEELELLELLKDIGEELNYNTKGAYEEIIEWLETHDGEMPKSEFRPDGKRLTRKDMTEEQINEINLYARWQKALERKALIDCIGIPIDELPEKYVPYKEQIAKLREYGLGIKKQTAYEGIIEWLETHDGRMPKGSYKIKEKAVKISEMTEEQRNEVNLYLRFIKTPEYNALMENVGIPLDELPEKYVPYKEQIAKLREYGLGIKKQTTYEELIQWLETHDGKMPYSSFRVTGKPLKANEMTEEQRYETNLSAKWRNSPEYRALKACIGIPLDEIPEEYKRYRGAIEKLREYGLGIKKQTTYEEVIGWLETHNGKMPRSCFEREGKLLKREQMTEEEKEEVRLFDKWSRTQECKALKTCIGIPLDKLPDEYKKYKEAIATLRNYGVGIETVNKKTVYKHLIQWLETHNGKMPHSKIVVAGKQLKANEMTEEQKYEVTLYERWPFSPERKALEACEGIPLDKIPEKYKGYVEAIATLREYGINEKLTRKTAYKYLIEWLENHDGKMPSGHINVDRKILKVEEMTKEQKYERNLRRNWNNSLEYKVYQACKGIPLDELPPEYEQYREEIATLRKYEEQRKAKKAEKLMRKSVGKRVQDNAETRQELANLVKEREEGKEI